MDSEIGLLPPPVLPEGALTGRRIVDLRFLSEQMICLECGSLLHLKDFSGEERRYGAASEIPLKCQQCKMIRFVYTSTDSAMKNKTRDRRFNVYDINCKLTLGTNR